MIKKVRNTVPLTYVISDLIGEKFVGRFYKKKLQKSNQKEKKHIKRKGNKPYIKWKVYNNSFNSWINKKEIV